MEKPEKKKWTDNPIVLAVALMIVVIIMRHKKEDPEPDPTGPIYEQANVDIASLEKDIKHFSKEEAAGLELSSIHVGDTTTEKIAAFIKRHGKDDAFDFTDSTTNTRYSMEIIWINPQKTIVSYISVLGYAGEYEEDNLFRYRITNEKINTFADQVENTRKHALAVLWGYKKIVDLSKNYVALGKE